MAAYASPTGEAAYTRSLPRTAESARAARDLVAGALAAWGLTELTDSAALVTAELMSNAVKHARYDAVRVSVARRGQAGVRITVTDRSRVLPKRGDAEDVDECGRGLAIVAALTGDRWGAEPVSWGKHVWAELGDTKEAT